MDWTLSQGFRSKGRGSARQRHRTLFGPGILAAAAAVTIACGAEPPPTDLSDDASHRAEQVAEFEWPKGPRPQALIEVAGFGSIVIDLYPELAPKTVANFIELAQEGFYVGTTFHRVVPGMMIQGGCPNTKDKLPDNDGQGGLERNLPDEFNAAPHVRGAVSMANTGRRNSGGTQFFVMHDDVPHLDGKHAIFGRVSAGMDVIDAITDVEVDRTGRWGPHDRPIENIVVNGVEILGNEDTVAESAAEDANDNRAS